MENGAVYVQTNDPEGNAIVAYRRAAGGELAALGTYPTGGRGNGKPHLPSQSSLVLTSDGDHLIVANTGSDDVSIFAVTPEGLSLSGRVPSGGSAPTSIAVHEQHVYCSTPAAGRTSPASSSPPTAR
jgi:6-phosphogluconolactonase